MMTSMEERCVIGRRSHADSYRGQGSDSDLRQASIWTGNPQGDFWLLCSDVLACMRHDMRDRSRAAFPVSRDGPGLHPRVADAPGSVYRRMVRPS
jgi:hypothetical protein